MNKKTIFILILILSLGLIFYSCEKDESTPDEEPVVEVDKSIKQLQDMQIFDKTTPADGETNVSIFTKPSIKFTINIGEEFKLVDNDYQYVYFRTVLDFVKFTNASGNEVESTIVWNDENNFVTFYPANALSAKQNYTLSAQIHFERKLGENNFIAVEEVSPKTFSHSFTIEKMPETIEEEHVAFTYPINNQQHFHKYEHNEGYILFKDGFNYSSVIEKQSGWTHNVYFIDESGNFINEEFSYNDNNEITFPIPDNLENETNYKLTFKKEPVEDNNAEDIIIYEIAFRTSKYDTFLKKMESFTQEKIILSDFEMGPSIYGAKLSGDEYFDQFELSKNSLDGILITAYADTNNLWFEKLNDIMYDAHPINEELEINWRDYTRLGAPPIKDVYLSNSNNSFAVQYNVARTTYEDYNNLKGLYYNYLIKGNSTNENIGKLLDGYYPSIRRGVVEIGRKYIVYAYLEYNLPGKNITTSRSENILIRGQPDGK